MSQYHLGFNRLIFDVLAYLQLSFKTLLLLQLLLLFNQQFYSGFLRHCTHSDVVVFSRILKFKFYLKFLNMENGRRKFGHTSYVFNVPLNYLLLQDHLGSFCPLKNI